MSPTTHAHCERVMVLHRGCWFRVTVHDGQTVALRKQEASSSAGTYRPFRSVAPSPYSKRCFSMNARSNMCLHARNRTGSLTVRGINETRLNVSENEMLVGGKVQSAGAEDGIVGAPHSVLK